MLTCNDFLAQLNDLLDDCADASVRESVQKHISECPNCWVIWDTTRRTIKVYKGLEAQPIPDDVHTRLLAAMHRRLDARSQSAGQSQR